MSYFDPLRDDAIKAINTLAISAEAREALYESLITSNQNLQSSYTQLQTAYAQLQAQSQSPLSLKTLLKPGSKTKIVAHLMIWFGSQGHINVGYNSYDPAVIASQLKLMKFVGIDAVVIDWYGSSRTNEDVAIKTWFTLAAQAGFQVGLFADKGLFKTADHTAELLNEISLLSTQFNSSAYLTDPISGKKVFGDFSAQNVDWTKIAAAHPEFEILHRAQPGGYIWENDLTTMAGWYTSLKPKMGCAYYQFDDHVPFTNLSVWGTNAPARYREGRGLHVWHQCWNLLPADIPMVQLVTWNDHEERTALEDYFSLSTGIKIAQN